MPADEGFLRAIFQGLAARPRADALPRIEMSSCCASETFTVRAKLPKRYNASPRQRYHFSRRRAFSQWHSLFAEASRIEGQEARLSLCRR